MTSLLFTSSIKLSRIRRYYPRHGAEQLDIFGADTSIAIVGANRSGISVFVSHNILYDMFPFWHRLFCPPRGLFLGGSYSHDTIKNWLKSELQTAGTARDEYPMRSINELILQRYTEQPIRNFLKKVFKDKLPRVFQPQPTIIIVDDAETLLTRYRCEFLSTFSELVRHAHDRNGLRLVFLVNSKNAVESLKVMHGERWFEIIHLPMVSKNACIG